MAGDISKAQVCFEQSSIEYTSPQYAEDYFCPGELGCYKTYKNVACREFLYTVRVNKHYIESCYENSGKEELSARLQEEVKRAKAALENSPTLCLVPADQTYILEEIDNILMSQDEKWKDFQTYQGNCALPESPPPHPNTSQTKLNIKEGSQEPKTFFRFLDAAQVNATIIKDCYRGLPDEVQLIALTNGKSRALSQFQASPFYKSLSSQARNAEFNRVTAFFDEKVNRRVRPQVYFDRSYSVYPKPSTQEDYDNFQKLLGNNTSLILSSFKYAEKERSEKLSQEIEKAKQALRQGPYFESRTPSDQAILLKKVEATLQEEEVKYSSDKEKKAQNCIDKGYRIYPNVENETDLSCSNGKPDCQVSNATFQSILVHNERLITGCMEYFDLELIESRQTQEWNTAKEKLKASPYFQDLSKKQQETKVNEIQTFFQNAWKEDQKRIVENSNNQLFAVAAGVGVLVSSLAIFLTGVLSYLSGGFLVLKPNKETA